MKTKALLVGINRYRSAFFPPLQGCVNDVSNWAKLLLSKGYNSSNLRAICDERATYEAIFDRLDWLADGARAGDKLFLQYSGHGSQVRDRDGDELHDGLDEIIIPHNATFDSKFISDDDMHNFLRALPSGCHITVVFDSCFSGTATRDQTASMARFAMPPVDIALRNQGQLPVKAFFSGVGALECDVTFIGTASDTQYAADANIGGVYQGAGSYALVDAITRHPSASLAEIVGIAQLTLRAFNFTQDIQIEGLAEGVFCG